MAFGLKYPRLSRDTVRYIQGGLVVAGTGLHRWPSNGIFYVVNLKEAHFYQKCHDTECYGFRSAAQQLPEYTMFWKYLDNTCDENFDEEGDLAIMMAATQVEQLQKSAEMSDEELLVAATAVEEDTVWDHMGELISEPSTFGSQPSDISSQEDKQSNYISSQTNTVWDDLSIISTPSSSAYNSQTNNPPCSQEIHEVHLFQENVDMDSETIENDIANTSEMEITGQGVRNV